MNVNYFLKQKIDLYKTFGISRNATTEEILNRQKEIDERITLFQENNDKVNTSYKFLNSYWDILLDTSKREKYNKLYDNKTDEWQTLSEYEETNGLKPIPESILANDNIERNKAIIVKNSLEEIKDKAIKYVSSLTSIPKDNILDYINGINNAQSKEEIYYIMNAIKIQNDKINSQDNNLVSTNQNLQKNEEQHPVPTEWSFVDEPSNNLSENPKTQKMKNITKFLKQHKKEIIIGSLVAVALLYVPVIAPAIMHANSVLWFTGSVSRKIFLHKCNLFLGKTIGAKFFPITGLWIKANGAMINATAATDSLAGALAVTIANIAALSSISVLVTKKVKKFHFKKIKKNNDFQKPIILNDNIQENKIEKSKQDEKQIINSKTQTESNDLENIRIEAMQAIKDTALTEEAYNNTIQYMKEKCHTKEDYQRLIDNINQIREENNLDKQNSRRRVA